MDAKEFLQYKGRPLVRSGNQLYYGNVYEPYVIMLQIMDEEPQGEILHSKRVIVKLFNTDPKISPVEAFEKTAEKNGLYAALDIADVWLTSALKKAKQ